MLAIVALLAAYTGFASAKWNTESSVSLAQASAARTEANRAALNAQNTKNFDSTTFNTWFTAYIGGDATAEEVADRRFRRRSRWRSTPGWPPTRSPIRRPHPDRPTCRSTSSRNWPRPRARRQGRAGVRPRGPSGGQPDNYVRDTIYLATTLFLIGISGHFRFFRIRLALIVSAPP